MCLIKDLCIGVVLVQEFRGDSCRAGDRWWNAGGDPALLPRVYRMHRACTMTGGTA